MHLANHLTLSRFYMTAVMIVCLSKGLVEYPAARMIALVVFVAGSLTDWLDGYLARKVYGVSSFGKLMDPLADKILVGGGFICFVELGFMPAWMVVLIISREFLVTGLRLLMVEKGVVMPAGIWGKVKTTIQMIVISLFFIGLVWPDVTWLPAPGSQLAWWMALVTTLLTVWSGVTYFWKDRALLFDAE